MEKQRNSNCWYIEKCQDDCFMCRTYLEMKWQMDNSGLPAKLQKPIEMFLTDVNRCDKSSYSKLSKIRKNIVDYVKDGNNLFICGRSGNGKTSWAVRLLQTYLHYKSPGNYERLQGMFISLGDLLIKLKDFNNPISKEYRDNIDRVPLIIWDDVCLTGISQFDYTQIYTMINNRMLAGLSNVFTTNVTDIETLEEVFGERLVSRIYNSSEIIELKGGDMR